jgi:hypothetical protein
VRFDAMSCGGNVVSLSEPTPPGTLEGRPPRDGGGMTFDFFALFIHSKVSASLSIND